MDALDDGASVRAVAQSEGIAPSSVRYSIRIALRAGRLLRIDGRGRHKRPVYRKPRAEGEGIESSPPPSVQTVAVPHLPPSPPNGEWRLIEHGRFGWVVHLSRGGEVPWDPASERMKNGTRWLKRRYHLLGSVWATVQLYSGTFRAYMSLDKVPVRWADAGRWNDLLWALAIEAQRRLGRDLADLGMAVTQDVPEPYEDPKAAAARAIGDPCPITGELRIPIGGVDRVPHQVVNAYTEVNGSPPGPAVETGSIKYGYVLDHLPERVAALEAAVARVMGGIERIETGVMSLADQMAKMASAQERMAAALETLVGPPKKDAEKPPERAPENPDNWRMFG